ncbi:MAG: DUF4422 domain-containing protein [bacterium]|nr:DUF4422 domain-containing protein [bacterium]
MMNLMIVTNSRYLKTTVVMLYSVFMNEPGEMTIYLPYEDLTEQECLDLKCFVESFQGKHLELLYVGTDFKEMVTSRNGILVETYYRIIGWGMLPEEVERILYLDVDLVVQGSLQPLYNCEMGDAFFVVCEDIFGKINGFHEANKKRLNIPSDGNYFNAGVMLVNVKKLRESGEVEHMLDCIYKDYERYEYNDQDVMNELYQDRLIYVGWDQFNCPPAWYYLDTVKAAQGIVEFADYEQLRRLRENPEAFAAQYKNLTAQIAQNATIIHHLADTKPWNDNRKEGKVYEIFDKCYYAIEPEALSYYYRITGHMAGVPSTPVLLYYGVTYCYNILNDLMRQLELGLQKIGLRTIAYDEQAEDVNGLGRFVGKKFLAVIGIQSYLFSIKRNETGCFLHDEMMGPKFNIVLDHPIWLKNQMEQAPADYYILTHDENYRSFIEKYFLKVDGSMMFPPAANELITVGGKPFAQRNYDVVFIGTYGDYREKLEQILECTPQVAHLANDYLGCMRKHTELTAEAALGMVLEKRGIVLTKEEFLELFFHMKPMIQCVMYYYREKVIRTLIEAGITVHIWGQTWEKSPFAKHSCLVIHPDVTPEESFDILKEAKISLNIMAWHKAGFTERLANSMRAGALVVTDATRYKDERLIDGQNICMFDLKECECLPKMLKELLAKEQVCEQIAADGCAYVMEQHTWKKRAEQLLKTVFELPGKEKRMETRIFTMTHKSFVAPDDATYIPLHVGRACAKDLGYLGDDTGDNISDLNCYYGELTGMYWMWRNIETEGNVGVCHYRRFFIHEDGSLLTEEDYNQILSEYDIMTSTAVKIEESYRDYFGRAHNVSDLQKEGAVIQRLYPEDYPVFCEVMDGYEHYFGNLLVASKKVFDEYCEWLFSIFVELSNEIDVSSYDDYHKRIFGFLSEQLLMVFVRARGLKVYEARVGLTGEKAETMELRRAMQSLLSEGKVTQAREMFYEVLKVRPDVRLPGSDVHGEIPIIEWILYICEVEQQLEVDGMLSYSNDLSKLMEHVRNLIEILNNIDTIDEEKKDYFIKTNTSPVAVKTILKNEKSLVGNWEQIWEKYEQMM